MPRGLIEPTAATIAVQNPVVVSARVLFQSLNDLSPRVGPTTLQWHGF